MPTKIRITTRYSFDTYELRTTAIGFQWFNTNGLGILSLGGTGSARKTPQEAWDAIKHRKGIEVMSIGAKLDRKANCPACRIGAIEADGRCGCCGWNRAE